MTILDQTTAVRLPAALAGLAALVVWETIQPFFPLFGRGPHARRVRLVHGVQNVAIGLGNGLVVRFGFIGAWIAVMEWSREHAVGLLHWITTPDWLRWALALLLLDLWTYAWHRLNHTVPVLWRFHRLHHSDRQMDATTASRFDSDSSVGSVKNAIRNGDFFDSARHFASNNNSSMSTQHSAIGNRNIFGWSSVFSTVSISTRFDGNAIVSHADVAIRNMNILAGRWIDSVCIG